MRIMTGQLPSGRTNPAPQIECWLPEGGRPSIGLIIFPGGGYGMLAEHEGRGYAEHFVQQGVACFVVTYRLGSQGFRHPAMLEDALAAVHTVRSSAAELGVDPHKIGVMGSSAGGHLTAHTVTAWNQYKGAVNLRPDFGILCYPVITAQGEFSHRGSYLNLLGEDLTPERLAAVSPELLVQADTSPCFIWHTMEDDGVPVENSLMFASALRKAKVPFELHVYTRGRHGLGLNTPFQWATDCRRWMDEITAPEDVQKE